VRGDRQVHTLHVIDSLQPAGAEISTVSQLPGLETHGARTTICHLSPEGGLGERVTARGFDVIHPGSRLGRRSAVSFVRDAIRSTRPDLVHTTLFEADLAGRLAARLEGIRAVSSIVNDHYGPAQRKALHVRRLRLLAAQAADVATATTVVRFQALSPAIAAAMTRRLRLPSERVDVIPRGRDLAALGRRTRSRRDAARHDLGVGPTEHLVVTVGRHERQKGLDVLVEAAARVRRVRHHVRFVVAGREGNETTALKGAIRDHGLDESFALLGHRRDVAELMCAADTLVAPSRWEGFGGVTLEAMALEAPIVTTDIPTARELLPDHSVALHVPPDSAKDLSSAILQSLTLPSDARQRASAARLRAERFDLDRVCAELADFYRAALIGKRRLLSP
jgi:glycosyltransferase involved in cell wall biosynthesis